MSRLLGYVLLPLATLACREATAPIGRGHPVPSVVSAGSVDYVVVDLGTLGARGFYEEAQAINNAGQIVGTSKTLEGHDHAFLWQNGQMIDLGGLSEVGSSYAQGINETSQVVGWSSGSFGQHAFLWQDGQMTDLGALPGDINSVALDINDAGQVVGFSYGGPEGSHAWIWENGQMTKLGTLGGSIPNCICEAALAINNAGQVVGSSVTPSGALHAFLWQSGQMSDLGTLPDQENSAATDISDDGKVVGNSNIPDIGSFGFLWHDGTMIDLGSLGGGPSTDVRGVNKGGYIVVGQSMTADAYLHPFFWEDGHLTDLLTPGNGVAMDVNDAGDIVGRMDAADGRHAVLWRRVLNTPIGSNVSVTPAQGVSVTFAAVTTAGQTTATTSSTGATPPSGFAVGNPSVYYDLTTTAVFQGPVMVCIDYSGLQFDTSPVSFFHWEDGAWVDRTSSVDESNHIVCAQVSAFSAFILAARIPLRVSIDIQPGSALNTIKLSRSGKVPVAILSNVGFDALSRVVRTSLTFGPTGKEASLASCARAGEDVNGDGLPDLVCQFYAQKTGFQVGDLVGILRGRTTDSSPLPIKGQDAVRILN